MQNTGGLRKKQENPSQDSEQGAMHCRSFFLTQGTYFLVRVLKYVYSAVWKTLIGAVHLLQGPAELTLTSIGTSRATP